jgi:hypothetical protein
MVSGVLSSSFVVLSAHCFCVFIYDLRDVINHSKWPLFVDDLANRAVN